MKRLAIASLALLPLLAAPLAASAQERNCRHQEPRELRLELDGVRTVRFHVANHALRLEAAATPDPSLRGRACASSAGQLQHLVVEQARSGDVLEVRLARNASATGWFGNQYARLDMRGQVPDNVLVQLVVGSGDAWLTGAAAMSADVGSGDVDARNISGQATVKVGSGDIELHDVGALKVLSIGSGDVEARRVRGDVEVGSIGSGDFDLYGADGDVEIGSIGSGDAELQDVKGSVSIGSIGSGDAGMRNIGGSITVRTIGSGDITVRTVAGDLTVSSKGSGSIRHEGVSGNVDVPRRR